jgi:hypothetical protein
VRERETVRETVGRVALSLSPSLSPGESGAPKSPKAPKLTDTLKKRFGWGKKKKSESE